MASFAPQFALAVVGAGRCRGQVSMSCCPGRAAPWLLPSVSQCELQRDVATIARWGAKALVTLLDEAELARLHLHKLSRLIAAAEITWYHVPLPFGILPDGEFDRSWNRVSLHLHQILREGGKVSIHCRDGRDRTGLMTARLLIELGCHPLDAMNRVRGARPGMLQSLELEDYLRRVQPARPEAVTRLELSQDGSSALGSRAAPLHSPHNYKIVANTWPYRDRRPQRYLRPWSQTTP